MGLFDWLLSPIQQGGRNVFTQLTTPPPSSTTAARISPTPATPAPTILAGQSQVATPSTPDSQEEQGSILNREGISLRLFRAAESVATTIRKGIPTVSEKLQVVPLVGKPLATVTSHTSESVARLISTGGRIPGGVEVIGGEAVKFVGSGATKFTPGLGAAVVTGVTGIPTGFIKSATEEPKQFASDILVGALLPVGVKEYPKLLSRAGISLAPQDILFGRGRMAPLEKLMVAEPGRGIVETYTAKNIALGIPEMKLKMTPSQLAGTEIQESLGGRTIVGAQVSPGGAQPFKINILTGERSFITSEIPGASPARQFAKETGFYLAPEELSTRVPYSVSAVARAEKIGTIIKPTPAIPQLDVLGEAVVSTIQKDKSIAGGSFAQKLQFRQARKYGDYDIISKNPVQTAKNIVLKAKELGEDYTIESDKNPIYGKYPKQMIFDKLGNKVAEVERTVNNTDLTTRKTVTYEGIKAVAPEELFVDKLAMVRGAAENIKASTKAARDIVFHTSGKISAEELLTPSIKPGTPQAYIYYAGIGKEPSFIDVLSGRAKIGSGGRPTISIAPELKISEFPKEVLEKPITSAEKAAIEADFAKLREGKFEGMKEIGGTTFSDLESKLRARGTTEQWVMARKLTTYAKEHPGTYSGIGALSGLRGEFEVIQSVGVKNILTPSTLRGKIGKYLGFGENVINVGGTRFEVQTFKVVSKAISKKTIIAPSEKYTPSRIAREARVSEMPEWIKIATSRPSEEPLPIYRSSRLITNPVKAASEAILKSSSLISRRQSIQSIKNIKGVSEIIKKDISSKSTFISNISRISRTSRITPPSPPSKISTKSPPRSPPVSITSIVSPPYSPPRYPSRSPPKSTSTIITTIIPPSSQRIFKPSGTVKNLRKKIKYPERTFFGYGEKAAIATATQILGRK